MLKMIKSQWNTPFLKQTWTVSGVLLSALAQGMVQYCMSVSQPTLAVQDSPIQTDLDAASWLASSFGLSTILGYASSSILMAVFGRRLSYALEIVPGFIGLLLIYNATNESMLEAGRILGGITAGATFNLGAVIIGEYTSPENRGMFLNLRTAALGLGTLIAHSLSHIYHWKTSALLVLVPHVVSFGIVCTWPESPAWLASKRRFYESENEFYWLRGYTKQSKKELEDMIKAEEQKTELAMKFKLRDHILRFSKMDFLKPIFIIFTAWTLLDMSGRHIFPVYASEIIGEIIGKKTNSFYYTLTIYFIITIGPISSSILIKFMKMRTLLFITGTASITVLIMSCTHLFLSTNDVISRDHHWIPISMFVLYFILVNLGCTTVPMALIGEIFPLAQRSSGLLASGLLSSVCTTAALKTFPFMLFTLKIYGTFAVLGTLMTLTLSVLYFVLPETKNRTLQEIGNCINCGSYDGQVIKQEHGIFSTHHFPLLTSVSPTVAQF